MKERRRRKKDAEKLLKEAEKLSCASPDTEQDSLFLGGLNVDDDNDDDCSDTDDNIGEDHTPEEPAPQRVDKKNSIRTLILQFSELGPLNDRASKKARDKLQKAGGCKHFFTNRDVKVIRRWLELLKRAKCRIEEEGSEMRWELVSAAFQSGPFSGSKVFEINRLSNAVLKWKSASGKGCSYMEHVLTGSGEFAAWLVVTQGGEGTWMTRNQRETVESFRNRIARINREIGEEEGGKEPVGEPVGECVVDGDVEGSSSSS
ncbi:hypothetical protein TrRE_jg983, partial [Triparma retinervis]